MLIGLPVITQHISFLPELFGNTGDYFAPNDQATIVQAMDGVVGSPTGRAELIALGLQQYCQFTWENCTCVAHEIYRNLL